MSEYFHMTGPFQPTPRQILLTTFHSHCIHWILHFIRAYFDEQSKLKNDGIRKEEKQRRGRRLVWCRPIMNNELLSCVAPPLAVHCAQSTHKAMHNDAPVYLCELVCPYQPTRTVRSANNNMLEVKRTRTKAGDCSFAVAAAFLWNNLPTAFKTC